MNTPAMIFIGRAAWLLGWSLALQEAAARCGAGALPLLRRRSFGPLGRAGAGALLGWGLYGTVLLALAALGLFRPAAIVAAGLACVLASRAAREIRPLWWDAGRAGWNLGWPWLLAFGAALAPLLVGAMTPGLDQDSFAYHLGAPWQWLQAGRLFAGATQISCHTPLLADLANIVPILLGDPRLSKALVIGSVVSGAAAWADRSRERGRPGAAWTGPLFAVSASWMVVLMNTGKNDLPACQFFLVGAILTLDGVWTAGAAFLGLALAAKFVYGPQIVLWLLVVRPPRRVWLPFLLLLVLPSLPWWWKTWSATANPLFPFASGVFGRYDWTPLNERVFETYQRGLWSAGTGSLNEVVSGGWLTMMKDEHLLLVLAWPGLVWFRRTRGVALACLAGEIVTLTFGHLVRYIIPSTVLLSCLLADEIARRPDWRRLAGGAALAAYALARIALDPFVVNFPWAASWRPLPAEAANTYGEAVQHLNTLHPARLISIGDTRLYQLPGRVLFGGMSGETPLIWQIAKASAGVDDVRRKFRQLGARWLLFNYVSVEWTEVPYLPFEWSDRDLRVYVDFCKRYLVPVWRTTTADYSDGGFYVFDLLPRPLPHPPSTTWFAPGTETVYGQGTAYQMTHHPPEALQGFLAGFKRLPDVGFSWNLVGHGYTAVGDQGNAFKYLRKFAEQGMMDALNLAEYAEALSRTEQSLRVERAFEDALMKYPTHVHVLHVNQAAYFGNAALTAILASKIGVAAAYLDRAEAMMNRIPAGADPGNAKGRLATRAFLIGLRGEVWFARGDRVQAARCFRDSTQMDMTARLSGRWKELADRLAPRMF